MELIVFSSICKYASSRAIYPINSNSYWKEFSLGNLAFKARNCYQVLLISNNLFNTAFMYNSGCALETRKRKLIKISSTSVQTVARKQLAPVCSMRKLNIFIVKCKQPLAGLLYKKTEITYNVIKVELYRGKQLHSSLYSSQFPLHLVQEWQLYQPMTQSFPLQGGSFFIRGFH